MQGGNEKAYEESSHPVKSNSREFAIKEKRGNY